MNSDWWWLTFKIILAVLSGESIITSPEKRLPKLELKNSKYVSKISCLETITPVCNTRNHIQKVNLTYSHVLSVTEKIVQAPAS